MKALSIKEPWISLIASGKKTIETRTWSTYHRGDLLLVGSKKPKGDYSGTAACIVTIDNCRPMMPKDEEKALCTFQYSAYSWFLSNVRLVQPFPARGQLKLYDVPDDKIIVIHSTDQQLAKPGEIEIISFGNEVT